MGKFNIDFDWPDFLYAELGEIVFLPDHKCTYRTQTPMGTRPLMSGTCLLGTDGKTLTIAVSYDCTTYKPGFKGQVNRTFDLSHINRKRVLEANSQQLADPTETSTGSFLRQFGSPIQLVREVTTEGEKTAESSEKVPFRFYKLWNNAEVSHFDTVTESVPGCGNDSTWH